MFSIKYDRIINYGFVFLLANINVRKHRRDNQIMDNIEKMTIDTQDTGISQIKQQQTLHTTIRKKHHQ
jgi:hypothetical protein